MVFMDKAKQKDIFSHGKLKIKEHRAAKSKQN